jgi:hypothetical protein
MGTTRTAAAASPASACKVTAAIHSPAATNPSSRARAALPLILHEQTFNLNVSWQVYFTASNIQKIV